MRTIVRDTPPELLVCCPPRTWAGSWHRLNKNRMSPHDRREKDFLTKLFIDFCGQLIEEQLKSGGRLLFEHPRDSVVADALAANQAIRRAKQHADQEVIAQLIQPDWP